MSKKIYISIVGFIIATIAIGTAIFYTGQDYANGNPTYTGGEEMARNRRITASQAKEIMEKYPDVIILDVRNYWEFTARHITGAISLPDFEISTRATDVLPDLYSIILVYCQSGNRSRGATSLLLSLGYVNVYDFGGINAWPYGTNTNQ